MTVSDPDGLNHRQRRFVCAILEGHSATRAAIIAGYGERSAAVSAWRMLRNEKIARVISAKQQAIAERSELSRELVIRRLIEIQAGERDLNSIRALELLGKHLGMFEERVPFQDPALMSTDELMRRRHQRRRELGLPV